jgi:hypothetical protein
MMWLLWLIPSRCQGVHLLKQNPAADVGFLVTALAVFWAVKWQ